MGERIRLDVKHRHKPGKIAEENPDRVQAVGRALEGRAIYEGPDTLHSTLAAVAGAQNGQGKAAHGAREKAQYADSPGKSDARLQFLENERIYRPAQAASNAGCGHRLGTLGLEVRRDDGNGRDGQETSPEADADGVGKDDLPVRGAETGHHEAEDDKECADVQQESAMACIIQGANDGSSRQEEKHLY
jgi:hypothetical protein